MVFAAAIPQVDAIDPAAFALCFVAPSRPVVLKGMARDWPAVRHWSFPALRAGFGEQRMRVRGSDHALDVFFGDVAEREMSFATYLDTILGERAEGRRPYMGNFLLNHPQMDPLVLRLIDNLAFPPFFDALPERQVRIWVAGAGQRSTIHNDSYENLNAQIIGAKSFLLFAPHDHDKLYAERVNDGLWASPIDTDAPQPERYPAFAAARGLRCTLELGDLLYIPRFWWHQATSETASVNVNAWYYEGDGRDETWPAWRDRLSGSADRNAAIRPG